MSDWKIKKQKYRMGHDRVERCMHYVKAVERDEERAETARRATFDKLLAERWIARQSAKNGAHNG